MGNDVTSERTNHKDVYVKGRPKVGGRQRTYLHLGAEFCISTLPYRRTLGRAALAGRYWPDGFVIVFRSRDPATANRIHTPEPAMLGDFLELSAAGGAEDAQSLTSFAWLARQADTRVYAGCCPTTLASGASQSAQGVQSSVGECKGVFGERGKAQLASMYALTAETLVSAVP